MENSHTLPKCMSTQHPDNASIPGFSDKPVLEGKMEVEEADYAFSKLGCDEQMWDAEGKEAYSSVVRTLLEKNKEFYKENVIGKDLNLTVRVPNPKHEKVEMKVLLEVLENIPRSHDTAKKFYNSIDGSNYDGNSPIFELILPMTTGAKQLDRIYSYYRENIGKRDEVKAHDIEVKSWLGETKPKRIDLIPLIEEKEEMVNSDKIVGKYIGGKGLDYQRVFLARSDPALNYGLVAAVLINKIALMKLHRLQEKTGADIYPIIGVGSAPFRGNLRPETVDRSLEEFPSVQTFTIQSAFKYDHPRKKVQEAIEEIKSSERERADEIDSEYALHLIEKYSRNYRRKVEKLADKVNQMSSSVPSRRSRKLHIGLFGYSRELDGSKEETKLPRAIKFTASLYSIGLPPEIIGLDSLEEKDFRFLRENYRKLDEDLESALRFLDRDIVEEFPFLEEDVRVALKRFDPDPEERHRRYVRQIRKSDDEELIRENLVKAAKLRCFLG